VNRHRQFSLIQISAVWLPVDQGRARDLVGFFVAHPLERLCWLIDECALLTLS
jgi:hypothetical protein